jgi:plastocyanin
VIPRHRAEGQPTRLRATRRRFQLFCALVVAAATVAARATDVAFTLVDPKGAPVADAVVSLIPLDNPARPTPPADPIEIPQSGQEFSTFVTPVVVGSTVIFPNADKVSHQVYSLSPVKKFALPLYKPHDSGTVVFDRPGVVALGCNIHDWMLAYVFVLETPWFAKSTADGAAKISSVPPGRYRAEAWHPTLKKSETREITLTNADATALAFTLATKPIPRIRRAPSAAGGGYK